MTLHSKFTNQKENLLNKQKQNKIHIAKLWFIRKDIHIFYILDTRDLIFDF